MFCVIIAPHSAFAGDENAGRALAAWNDLGRPGKPKLWGQGYFAFGDPDGGDAYLRDYYAFLGPYADQVADRALRSKDAIRGALRAFEDAGITELTFDPTTTSLEQVDRLADMVL